MNYQKDQPRQFTPQQIMKMRMQEGDIIIIIPDQNRFKKTPHEKMMLATMKQNHKAALRRAGLNPRKYMNVPGTKLAD